MKALDEQREGFERTVRDNALEKELVRVGYGQGYFSREACLVFEKLVDNKTTGTEIRYDTLAKEVRKYNARGMYSLFTSVELRILDSLDISIDAEQAKQSKQKPNDWFHNKKPIDRYKIVIQLKFLTADEQGYILGQFHNLVDHYGVSYEQLINEITIHGFNSADGRDIVSRIKRSPATFFSQGKVRVVGVLFEVQAYG